MFNQTTKLLSVARSMPEAASLVSLIGTDLFAFWSTALRLQIDPDNDDEKSQDLKIMSHWNRSNRVHLVTPSGEKFTLLGADIIKAIENAMRTGR